MKFDYVIVGGGLAAVSAIEGIRSHDPSGSIVMLSRENHPPYQRPPLSKDLWFGKLTKDQLPIHDQSFYSEQRVDLWLRREVVEVDAARRAVWDDRGTMVGYGKLLIATGGWPRRLNVEGSDHEAIR